LRYLRRCNKKGGRWRLVVAGCALPLPLNVLLHDAHSRPQSYNSPAAQSLTERAAQRSTVLIR
jgi:hypothetical protein